LSVSVGSVLFPAFAKIQDDDAALRWSFKRATCVITMVIFPLLAGLLVVAPTFITFVYGERWEPTVFPLQMLCVAGLLYSVEPVAVSLINARGLLVDDIKRQSVHLFLLAVATLTLSKWGITGIASAVTFAAFANWILLIILLSRRIGFAAAQYVESVLPATLASLVMVAAVAVLQNQVPAYFDLGDGWLLLLSVGCGAAVYYAALLILNRYLKWRLLNESFAEIQGVINSISRPLLRALGVVES